MRTKKNWIYKKIKLGILKEMEICYELKEYHGSKLAWGIFFFY
jgi:hypothetical protein